jgi:hypothetical protein
MIFRRWIRPPTGPLPECQSVRTKSPQRHTAQQASERNGKLGDVSSSILVDELSFLKLQIPWHQFKHSMGNSLSDRHGMFALRQTARTGAQSPDIQFQGRGRAGERIAVHTQLLRCLALIAVIFPEHSSNEPLPELSNGFGVENATFVHPAYECVHLVFHIHDFLRRRYGEGVRRANYPAERLRSITQMLCNTGGAGGVCQCIKNGH